MNTTDPGEVLERISSIQSEDLPRRNFGAVIRAVEAILPNEGDLPAHQAVEDFEGTGIAGEEGIVEEQNGLIAKLKLNHCAHNYRDNAGSAGGVSGEDVGDGVQKDENDRIDHGETLNDEHTVLQHGIHPVAPPHQSQLHIHGQREQQDDTASIARQDTEAVDQSTAREESPMQTGEQQVPIQLDTADTVESTSDSEVMDPDMVLPDPVAPRVLPNLQLQVSLLPSDESSRVQSVSSADTALLQPHSVQASTKITFFNNLVPPAWIASSPVCAKDDFHQPAPSPPPTDSGTASFGDTVIRLEDNEAPCLNELPFANAHISAVTDKETRSSWLTVEDDVSPGFDDRPKPVARMSLLGLGVVMVLTGFLVSGWFYHPAVDIHTISYRADVAPTSTLASSDEHVQDLLWQTKQSVIDGDMLAASLSAAEAESRLRSILIDNQSDDETLQACKELEETVQTMLALPDGEYTRLGCSRLAIYL